MIILAGVIIIQLNNSEIIKKAEKAVDETNLQEVKQLAALKWSEAYLEGEGKSTEDELRSAVETGLTEAKIDISKYDITVTTKGVSVEVKDGIVENIPTEDDKVENNIMPVPDEWKENIIAVVDNVPIPKGFVASPYGAYAATGRKAENTKAGGLVIYELAENETAIPSDETYYESLTERNQYVWVPVDNFTKFKRQNFGMSRTINETSLGSADTYWEVILNTTTNMPDLEKNLAASEYMTVETPTGGITNTLEEVQAMYASVKKYGGFYIARYEAGIDAQRTAKGNAIDLPGIKAGTKVYSVMGKIPYTNIPWTWYTKMNGDTNGAVEVARRMYPATNTNYGVVSTLTYGVQWDTAVQWFIDTGAMTLNQVNRIEGSTAFGNYSDHVINSKEELNYDALVWDYTASSSGSYVAKDSNTLTYPKVSGTRWALSTGALKAANINNIYDMAGNMWEWSMEGSSTDNRVNRGGSFYIAGSPVSNRVGTTPNNVSYFFGFRPSLYIK